MADFLSFKFDSSGFDSLRKLAYLFPVATAQALGFIGVRGKYIMQKEMLSGQLLHYRKGKGSDEWHDKKGRRKASYRIERRRTLILSSYPANFFTVGPRKLRGGGVSTNMTPLYQMLRVKLESRIDGMLKEFDRKYFQDELDKFDKSPSSRKRF